MLFQVSLFGHEVISFLFGSVAEDDEADLVELPFGFSRADSEE